MDTFGPFGPNDPWARQPLEHVPAPSPLAGPLEDHGHAILEAARLIAEAIRDLAAAIREQA